MIQFLYHDGIQKEIAAIKKRRLPNIEQDFNSIERLCQVQFDPNNPRQVIAPTKLHRIKQNDVWVLWKIELAVRNTNLKPNQWPRLWFVVRGATIVFLCIASHIDNYNDEEKNNLALSRLSDYF
ncbi:hypothetical protein HY933_02285 [Candidatus Falkowbacteria bacterium]|nr:hypothetical protein [Candidatus Falkowbacteria bacterium]